MADDRERDDRDDDRDDDDNEAPDEKGERDVEDDEEPKAGDEEDHDGADREDDQDLVEELEDEVEALREQVRELERQLAEARRGSARVRWGTWILGTFAVVVTLVLVVLFLGQGLPTSTEPAAGPVDEGGQPADEEALNALVMAHASELQDCLDALAGATTLPDGTILATAIEVRAREGGAVTDVQVNGEDIPAGFAACLERSVSSWTFPSAGAYVLQAPFEIRRGGHPGSPDAGDEGAGPPPPAPTNE